MSQEVPSKHFSFEPDEEFTLTMGERIYVLRYDFAAFRIYEKAANVNPFAPEFVINSANLDTFLWAGLRHRSPSLTLEQVQAWITPSNAVALLDFVGEAYFAAFPKPDPTRSGAADPPSA
jgi:hypothetical protein